MPDMRDWNYVTVELLPELRAESEVGEMIERCVAEEAESLLRDMQEYRDLSDRIRSMFGDAATLKDVVDSLERKLLEPEKPDPVNARILTYEESAMWDAYRAIGTLEQCREAVERTRWIPVSERPPEERDSIFAKLKGTDKWKTGMFEKTSGTVIATVCSNDGSHRTTTAHTNDGRWKVNTLLGGEEVVAWMPLPEPYHITNPDKKESNEQKQGK